MEVNTERIREREMQRDFFYCNGKQRDRDSPFAGSSLGPLSGNSFFAWETDWHREYTGDLYSCVMWQN